MSTAYFFMKDIDTSQVQGDNRREVYWPKTVTQQGHYDPSLRRTFQSKQEMRQYMAANKLRDAGERINPDKHIAGRSKTHRDSQRQAAIQQHIQRQGGTDGLLQRIREQRERYL